MAMVAKMTGWDPLGATCAKARMHLYNSYSSIKLTTQVVNVAHHIDTSIFRKMLQSVFYGCLRSEMAASESTDAHWHQL